MERQVLAEMLGLTVAEMRERRYFGLAARSSSPNGRSPALKNSPGGTERTMSPVRDACVLCVSHGSCRRGSAGWRSRKT